MPVKSRIVDGGGSGQSAKVVENGLVSMILPRPPFSGDQKMRAFRQFLTNDGTSSGDNDMRTDGSTIPVEFYVVAPDDEDLYIKRIIFVISDFNATLNSFGTLSALTNGCDFEYQDERGTVTISDSLTTNFEFVRMCTGTPAFGDGSTAFRANNVSGNSEGYLPYLDFAETFGFTWGVKLDAGSSQKLILRVNDDTSSVDEFTAVCFGFTRRK